MGILIITGFFIFCTHCYFVFPLSRKFRSKKSLSLHLMYVVLQLSECMQWKKNSAELLQSMYVARAGDE